MRRTKIFLYTIFLVLMIGCATTDVFNPSTIVDSHYSEYVNSGADNENVSAILKEFTVQIFSSNYDTWSNVQIRENMYVGSLITNTISSNYTIMATSAEVKVADGLLDDAIRYHNSAGNYPWIAGQLISETVVQPFIWRINEYEFNKVTVPQDFSE